MTLSTSPNDTTLDKFHSEIVEAVTASDRARIAAGEREFVRFAIPHENGCPTGCIAGPSMVRVTLIAPGHRRREGLWIDGGRA